MRYRICNIEITEEQAMLLQRYLPYGVRGKIYKQLIDNLIEELRKPTAAEFVAKLLMKEIGIQDLTGGTH